MFVLERSSSKTSTSSRDRKKNPAPGRNPHADGDDDDDDDIDEDEYMDSEQGDDDQHAVDMTDSDTAWKMSLALGFTDKFADDPAHGEANLSRIRCPTFIPF